MESALESDFAAQASAPRWWIALSGGVDSVVLLDLMHRWLARHQGPSLTAIHVHHGLQSGADDWAALCQQQCDRYNIPLETHRVAIGDATTLGIEAAARAARYAVFEARLNSDDILFQAHHLDDQAETLLLRLLRGAGPQGLSGIPGQRALCKGHVCRPLLEYPKRQLEDWARARGLRWVTDPSNSDPRFDRNYLRQQVMPLLAARWPGYRQTFARAAALQAESVKFLAQAALPQCTSIFGDPGMSLLTETGEAATAVQLNQALHAWLTRSGVPVPSRVRLQEFSRQLLAAAADRQPELSVGDVVLRRWRGAVYRLPADLQATRLSAPSGDISPGTDGRIPKSLAVAQHVAADWGELHWRVSANSRLQRGMQVMLRQPLGGERFALVGRRHKSFKQLCQEAGVPPWWRDRLAVMCLEHRPVAILGLGLLAEGARDDVNVTNSGYEPVYIPFVPPNSIE
mgnify:CR=1 FL=1